MSPLNPNYFLGKVFDPKTNSLTADPVLLDPANLTTHCVVTGMTGSGKTGLCIGLLEEAALHQVPALIIDPKGDLTNLVLHFPNQDAADFEPWIDPEAARREGKTVAQMASETAERWKKGLADWGMGRDQLEELSRAATYTIYSPGSTAGVPVNILSSFEAPAISWEENVEILRERISTTVTAILGLVGMSEIDPLRSREHILLSSLIENAWMGGKSLSLTELILQVQNPPLERLGAFPMDSFFPEKDRFDLALLLNNFLASPSFQVWQQGQPLDIQALLFTKEGTPRHSIFYLAHLSENERMFFVTLLFAAVESWMRSQRGTGNLRALLYFDEIMGYLPPVANPASKTVMLRMLKQARAFGVGLLLATQNPVDVDYKALSNAGTWMIGRLQTEQDKQRLLDGLSSAGGTTDLQTLDKLISGLQKRVFMLHSVYRSAPVLFNTRWALNYLAGPMTRDQLRAANALAGVKILPASSATPSPVATTATGKFNGQSKDLSSSRPAIRGDVSEYFMPNNLGLSSAAAKAGIPAGIAAEGFAYRPGILAQAEVRYLSRAYNLEHTKKITTILEDAGSGLIRWEESLAREIPLTELENSPLANSQFHPIPAWLADPKKIPEIKKDFLDWIYRSGGLKIRANAKLKLYADPAWSEADFNREIERVLEDTVKAESEKALASLDAKITAMERKIESQELDVRAAESAVGQRRLETLATGGSTVIGMLTGKRRSLSGTLSKNRMASAAKDRLEAEKVTLKQYQDQLSALQKERAEAEKQIQEKWAKTEEEVKEVTIKPQRSDIYLEAFAIVWLPYYLVRVEDSLREIPAFER